MNYSKDELEPPKWMNKYFFQTVLAQENCQEVLEFKITPAATLGDHFASIMFRAAVLYVNTSNSRTEISLIIKAMPEQDGAKQDLLKDSKIFETEIKMYSDVLPKFEEILWSSGDNTILCAKMIYHSLEPNKIIVFQDIKKIGFEIVRNRMLTINEIKLVINKLTKWHAASCKYNSENSGSLENLKDGLFALPGAETNDMFTDGTSSIIKVIENIPELTQYLPKLRKIEKKLFPKTQKLYEVETSSQLKVLNHGDLHGKNMMFRFDSNGIAEEMMMVDFQLCVWGSMAIYLIYMIYLAIDFPTRRNHRDELIYYYFNQFIDTLKLIKYKGKLPSFEELRIDMIKLSFLEVFYVVSSLPYMHQMAGTSAAIDPEKLMESKDERTKAYQIHSYIEEIEELLPKFLNNGYFDEI